MSISTSKVFLAIMIFMGVLGPALTQAQEVRCSLTNVTPSSISGTCAGIIPPVLQLTKSNGETDVLWEGSATEGNLVWPFDIALTKYSDGEELVVRYEMGWYYIDEFNVSGQPQTLSWNMNKVAAPSQKDIQILDLAQSKLNNGATWNREDNRECEGHLLVSLYCALLAATEEVMKKPYHRQPAMQVVRQVIGTRWSERFSDHRLMGFNNNSETDFDDLIELFDEAKSIVNSTMR